MPTVLCASLLLTCLQNGAVAQAVVPSVDAARYDNLMARERHQPTPPDKVRAPVRTVAVAEVTEQDKQAYFYLQDIQFDGMYVYDPDEIAAPIKGREISLAELKQFVAELTARYRNDGYILSRAILPPQTIKDGVVLVEVTEGRIAEIDIRWQGDMDERTVALAKGALSKLTDGRALRTKDLERAMLLLGDLPGLSAESVLSPSEYYADASLLTVVLTAKNIEMQFGADNHGSRYLGPFQLIGSGAFNSTKGWRERVTYQYAYAPSSDMSRELFYSSVGWQFPITASGLVFGNETAHTRTSPGYRLTEFDVTGKSTSSSVYLSYPFERTRAFSLTGYAAMQFRLAQHTNNIDFGRIDRLYTSKIGTRVEKLDGWFNGGFNFADISLSKGLVFGNSSRNGDLFMSRPDADVGAWTVNIDAERHQFLDDKNSLLFGFSGQWSSGALLSSREFGVGGSYIGRGYDPSEIVGDQGMAMRVELRHQPDLLQNRVITGHVFGFADGGVIWNDDATTPSQARQTLLSAGVGLRTAMAGGFDADFMAAFPLNREVESSGEKDARFLFSVRKRF